jgi:hypothetical protein
MSMGYATEPPSDYAAKSLRLGVFELSNLATKCQKMSVGHDEGICVGDRSVQ